MTRRHFFVNLKGLAPLIQSHFEKTIFHLKIIQHTVLYEILMIYWNSYGLMLQDPVTPLGVVHYFIQTGLVLAEICRKMALRQS
jgi:hypothetical protein